MSWLCINIPPDAKRVMLMAMCQCNVCPSQHVLPGFNQCVSGGAGETFLRAFTCHRGAESTSKHFCVKHLDAQEKQARATQYDQDMPATTSQSRQESWPSSASASSQQSNVSSQSREDGQQQQQQQQKVPSAYQQPQLQNKRTQKSWGSDIDLNSLDDWDSD